MRTIGKRYPRRKPGGDYRTWCDECMAAAHRKDLVLRADGKLYHRHGKCQPSYTMIEGQRMNAARQRQPARATKRDGGTV